MLLRPRTASILVGGFAEPLPDASRYNAGSAPGRSIARLLDMTRLPKQAGTAVVMLRRGW